MLLANSRMCCTLLPPMFLPVQVTCCNSNFCRECLQQLMSEAKPCPQCKAHNFNGFSNDALRKELRRLLVHCPNMEEGCMWTGKMKKLASHLGPNAPDSCPFVEIECASCYKPVRREELALHASQNCPQRAYECQYCGKYRSTFEDVVKNHVPRCQYKPTSCPNGCRESPVSLDLQSHVENDCPLTAIECEFKFFGCMEMPLRNEIDKHLQTNYREHTKMLASTLEEVVRQNTLFQLEMRRKIQDLKEENYQLKNTIEEMAYNQQNHGKKNEKSSSSHSPIVIIQQTSSHNQVRNGNHDNTATTENATTPSSRSSPQPEMITLAQFTINDYTAMKRNNHGWFSPPFYTRQQGYRMCLKVMTNGEGSGTGQYVAIYLHLMSGEFDDTLSWPFRGELVVELLSQKNDGMHPPHTHIVRYTEATPRKHASRVVNGECAQEGKGTSTFIHLSDLAMNYLHNDSLVFRITRIKHQDTTSNTIRRHTHIF